MANVILSAFLDGFTGGSLFTEARLPGEPTQLFADEDAECQQSELVASLLAMQKREDEEAGRAARTEPAYASFESSQPASSAAFVVPEGLMRMYPRGYEIHVTRLGPIIKPSSPGLGGRTQRAAKEEEAK